MKSNPGSLNLSAFPAQSRLSLCTEKWKYHNLYWVFRQHLNFVHGLHSAWWIKVFWHQDLIMSRLLVSKCTEKKKLIFYFIEFLFQVKKLVVNLFGLQTSLTNWRVSVIRFHRKGGCCCWLTHCQNSFSIYLSKQCLKTTKKIVLLGWGCKGKKKQSHKFIMWVSKSVCEYFQLLIIPSAMHSIHMRSRNVPNQKQMMSEKKLKSFLIFLILANARPLGPKWRRQKYLCHLRAQQLSRSPINVVIEDI